MRVCVCAHKYMYMLMYVCFPYLSELHFCPSPFLFPFLTTPVCGMLSPGRWHY